MAETEQPDKKHRSPAYPFVPLKKALERAQTLYGLYKRHAVPLAVAAKAWEYGEKSSGGLQTVSALKQYGLVADEGSGAARKIQLTQLALAILLDEVPNSAERTAAIKRAALSPKLYAEMFEKWGADLPGDELIRTFLKRDKLYNDDAVSGLIKDYKDTLAHAKLSSSDKIKAEEGVKRDPQLDMAIAAAAEVFPPPTPVVMQPGQPVREVSSLPEGEAMLQWPANLSPESVQDLEDWLGLVIKKMKRRYAQEKP